MRVRVVRRPARSVHRRFERKRDAFTTRPGDRAAVAQVHVFFEVQAQVLVIVVGQEGFERDLDAEPGAVGIGESGAITLVFGGEEDAEFFFIPGFSGTESLSLTPASVSRSLRSAARLGPAREPLLEGVWLSADGWPASRLSTLMSSSSAGQWIPRPPAISRQESALLGCGV